VVLRPGGHAKQRLRFWGAPEVIGQPQTRRPNQIQGSVGLEDTQDRRLYVPVIGKELSQSTCSSNDHLSFSHRRARKHAAVIIVLKQIVISAELAGISYVPV
jgi:hypothetical protein